MRSTTDVEHEAVRWRTGAINPKTPATKKVPGVFLLST
jgi:hypothetical protein